MSDYIVTNDGLMRTDKLTHHGVLGMKWGVRKDRSSSGSVKKKTSSEVSDEELKIKIARLEDELNNKKVRLELEKRYEELSNPSNLPKSTRGKDFVARVIKKIGKNTLDNIGKQLEDKPLPKDSGLDFIKIRSR